MSGNFKTENKSSPSAAARSARLSAVQAVYQSSQNKQSLRALAAEYLEHRSNMEIEGEALVRPDGALLKAILLGVDERLPELTTIVDANLKKDAADRDVEPLLKSILICGAYELMVGKHDAPLVINDYLHVAHAFYERSEVGLVNGVLDSISKIFDH